MTNTVLQSPLTTKEAAEKIEQFRLVELDDTGKIKAASGNNYPYGYIAQAVAPEAKKRLDNDLSHGLPSAVAVVTCQAVVDIAIDPTETGFDKGTVFKPGALVFAGADGCVCTQTKAPGGKLIGFAERADHAGRVRVNLFHPAAMAMDVIISG